MIIRDRILTITCKDCIYGLYKPKEAMQIANHPSLTQTGEHLDAEGNLFAPRFSLDGEHELPALRADLDNRFIISAQEDILVR